MRKCQLAISRKKNIVAGGIIVCEYGPNYLVVADVPYEPNTSLPISISDDITIVGEAVGYEVLWPAHLIILNSHPNQVRYFYIFTYNLMSIIFVLILHKEILNLMFFIGIQEIENRKEYKNEIKSKCENPQDIKNFDTMVGLMFNYQKVNPLDIPSDVFGEDFRNFLMKEDMDMIISSKEVLGNYIIFYIW